MVMSRLAVALESRNERRHAIDQAELALLDQHHHARRRRHHLGQRSDVEDRVERHRLGRRHQRPVADRLLIDDAVADADEDDGARQPLLADLVAHQRLDRVELADVETGGDAPRCWRAASGTSWRHTGDCERRTATVNLARRYVMGMVAARG